MEITDRKQVAILNIRFYRGNDLSSQYTEDLQPDPSKFTLHVHPNAELIFFVSGDAIYHVEGSEYALEPGDVLLIRPGECHYIELLSTAPYKRLVLWFDPQLFHAIDPKDTLMRPYFQREAGKHNLYRKSDFGDCEYEQYFRLLYEHTDSRHGSIAALLLLMTAINRVYDTALPVHTQTDTLEHRMLRYINIHLSEQISLEHMAQIFFMSRAQMFRRFKRATGSSIGCYINAKRMLAARELLLSGKKPTEIYAYCGYTDYSTFYRAYRKYYGYSPKEELSGQLEKT